MTGERRDKCSDVGDDGACRESSTDVGELVTVWTHTDTHTHTHTRHDNNWKRSEISNNRPWPSRTVLPPGDHSGLNIAVIYDSYQDSGTLGPDINRIVTEMVSLPS